MDGLQGGGHEGEHCVQNRLLLQAREANAVSQGASLVQSFALALQKTADLQLPSRHAGELRLTARQCQAPNQRLQQPCPWRRPAKSAASRWEKAVDS